MHKILLQITLILFVLINFTGCSAKKLYDMTMEYERNSAGLERKSITLNFGEIVYLENDVKSDVTLVLIHGFGANKDTWNRMIAEWDDRYHVIVLDLPGHGESISNKTLGYTTTHQAEKLDTFLEAKKVKNFYLVGHSMGGAIALRYVQNHTKNVNALILIDAMGMVKTKSEGTILVEQSHKNPLYDVCTKERLEVLLNYSMHKIPYIPDMFKDVLLLEKCARKELEKVMYEDLFKDVELSSITKRINIPTLILWGEKDRILHIDNAKLFYNTIKGSQLVIFEGIGHVPILEDPEKIADEVDKFINKMNKE